MVDKISHEVAWEYLHRRLEGLDALERARLEAHLAACPDCRAYQAWLDRREGALRAAFHARWDGINPPRRKESAWLAGKEKSIMRRPLANFAGLLAGIAALVALVLGLSWVFSSGLFVPPSPTQAQPAQEQENNGTPIGEIVAEETPDLPSPTPEKAEETPRTLTICQGAEPATLFLYDGAMLAKSNVLEAIYDGPIDTNGFSYQAVILEKLPSLADGDARLGPVLVNEGDWVVNAAGELVQIVAGEVIRPYGCDGPWCDQPWQGQALPQLSADFTLLAGLRWSDGEPLTAGDSLFSFRIASSCKDPYSSIYCGNLGIGLAIEDVVPRTAGYEQVDERTVRWTGVPGYLNSHYMATFFQPLPEHQIGGMAASEMLEADVTRTYPLGWGPYVIEKYEPGKEIRLVKNPYYFRAAEGLPRFDHLVIRFAWHDAASAIPDSVADMEQGKCDILDEEASLFFAEDIPTTLQLQGEGKLQAHFTAGTTWEHLDFGIQPGAYDDGHQPGQDRPDYFGDVRVRQAIALCLDRGRIADRVALGQAPVLDTYLLAEHPLFNPNVPRYPYDPAAGMAMLEEAGWVDHDGDATTPRLAQGVANVPDGTQFIVNYWTTTAHLRQELAGPIILENLAACGIEVVPQFFAAADLFADPPDGPLFGRQFELAEFAWLTGVDPPCELFTTPWIPGDPTLLDENGQLRFPRGWAGQNNTGYSNPEFDAACLRARNSLPGSSNYVADHFLAQEIFARDLPVIPLFPRIKLTITRPDIAGYSLDATGRSDFWSLEAIDRLGE